MPIYKVEGKKKDGLQKYRVIVNYTDQAGKHHQIERITYGSTEAKTLEQELIYSKKKQTPSQRMTLRELFDEYKQSKKYEVRESTLDKSSRILECHILSALDNKNIDKLNLKVLQNWKLSMDEKDISHTTKRNAYSEFRTLLNYAVKMEYLPKNPLTKLGNFKSTTETKKEMAFYTIEEFEKFIAAARECAQEAEKCNDPHEWNYYVFFAIAFFTGLRKGEIHALRWDDIEGEYLSVKHSISQKLKGEDRETAPKNKTSIRTLQIPAPLIKILNNHKERCKQIDGFSDTCYVCGGIKPLRDSTIQRRNERYAELAAVKAIRIHDFRHSHVSLLANEGINIQEIARRLGHAKIEMTWNTYSHLYPREEERAINILNKIHG